MYTQIMNFSMFMLVAHRNMISVYDMTKKKKNRHDDVGSMLSNQSSNLRNRSNASMLSHYSLGDELKAEDEEVGEWIDTVTFEHGQIREMFVKKRPKIKNEELKAS